MNKKHLSSQAEGLILWGSLLCTIIITKATKSKSKEQFQQVELVLPSVLGVCRENKAWVLLCLTRTSCVAQGPIYLLPLKLILRFPVLSRVLLFAILWTVAHQAPLAMGFSKQEYWKTAPSGSQWLVAISFSRGSSWPRDRTPISFVPCIGKYILYCSIPEKLFQMGISNNRGE